LAQALAKWGRPRAPLRCAGMSAAQGPGPVLVDVDDLPTGWEAFATNNADKYFCFPQIYYYCRELDKVQWDRPEPEDARDEYAGETINGRKPYEKGDEFIPVPPLPRQYDGPLSDANYTACVEDPEEFVQPDEDMLEACIDADMDKLQKALSDGADISLPNYPWQNSPLHLASSPFFWDFDTFQKEKQMRLELAQYIVRQGADLDVENIFHAKPVDVALFHGYEDIVSFLEGEGSSPGWFGNAFRGDLDRVKEFLENGQDIDLQGRYRRTAFAEAHLRGHWAVEIFLAQQGCSRQIFHPENLKFNPGGAAVPRGNLVPKREKQYFRDEDIEWYDDMMEKRYPGYYDTMKKRPK